MKISTAHSISSYYTQSLICLLILKGEGLWQHMRNPPLARLKVIIAGEPTLPAWAELGSSGRPAHWGFASDLAPSQPPAGSSGLALPRPGGCVMLWMPHKHSGPKHPTLNKLRTGKPQVCCSWLMRLMPTFGFISQQMIRLTHASLQHSFSSHA